MSASWSHTEFIDSVHKVETQLLCVDEWFSSLLKVWQGSPWHVINYSLCPRLSIQARKWNLLREITSMLPYQSYIHKGYFSQSHISLYGVVPVILLSFPHLSIYVLTDSWIIHELMRRVKKCLFPARRIQMVKICSVNSLLPSPQV